MKKHYTVKINYDWCKKCGNCYHVCPTKTIKEGNLKAPTVENHDTCVGCLMCENLCPDFAIDIVENVDSQEGEKV